MIFASATQFTVGNAPLAQCLKCESNSRFSTLLYDMIVKSSRRFVASSMAYRVPSSGLWNDVLTEANAP